MPGIYELKPPRVRFDWKEVEDRDASIKAGRKVYKNVIWAFVNPAGSKDEVERVADEWVQTLKNNVMRYGDDPERAHFEQRLLDAVETALEKFKKGHEMPETGTPIRMCLMFTPAEQRVVLNANIYTLEELAACNEQALAMIGMGARELKHRAQTALDTANNSGKAAEKINALEVENDSLKQRLAALEEAMKGSGQLPVAVDAPKRRGRPPKVAVAG